jgi:hypothetical protein
LINIYRFAYIEFESKDSAMKAKLHNDSLFKGRQITVIPKRKNIPGQGGAGMFRGRNNMAMQMASMISMMMGRGGMRGGRGGFRGAPRGGAPPPK